MSIGIILGNDLKKIDRQITVLEYIIPKDNEKDKTIHTCALNLLKNHRQALVRKGD